MAELTEDNLVKRLASVRDSLQKKTKEAEDLTLIINTLAARQLRHDTESADLVRINAQIENLKKELNQLENLTHSLAGQGDLFQN